MLNYKSNFDANTMPHSNAIHIMLAKKFMMSNSGVVLASEAAEFLGIPKASAFRFIKGKTSRFNMKKVARKMFADGLISKDILDGVIIECSISKRKNKTFKPVNGQWHYVVRVTVEERLYTDRDDWVAFEDMNTALRMQRKAIKSLQQRRFVRFGRRKK